MTRNKIEALLLEAKECLQQGRRDDALGCIRTALTVDPGEMVITEVILNLERSRTSSHVNGRKAAQPEVERKSAENMDPKLEKAFRLSDEALEAGNEAKALAYMKKASQLFPDEVRVQEKLNLLKNRIRAGNLVKIGLKSLEEGNLKKAVAASRKAFDLLPEANGLDELLSAMEKVREPAHEEIPAPEEPSVEQSGAMLWADRIRAAVKDEKFEEAGRMVAEAVKTHPNNPLLDSFHIKLKRLGFAD
jgi:tetratricopeptide (TPR) repeat protein